MAKKTKIKTEDFTEEIGEVVKKVKSAFMDALVREWLNNPSPDLGGKSPIQIIKDGDGQRIIESIKLAEEQLKHERNTNIEESVGKETVSNRKRK